MVKRNSQNQFRMRAIIRRSKPACHICGGVILWDAPFTDPKSFVVDHVIPLARGGEDGLSNAKAAHRHKRMQ